MPRPLTDRQRWEEELAELPTQIARWKNELISLTSSDRVRREMLIAPCAWAADEVDATIT